MNETHEPSYYEIALTNRQVMVVFVVLLMSVITAFLSGVWVGRGDPIERTVVAERMSPVVGGSGGTPVDSASLAGGGDGEGEVRSLNFFTDERREREPEAPLAKVVESPKTDTTLLEDVGGRTPPPIVEEAPPKPAPKATPTQRAPTPAKPEPRRAETTAPAPAPEDGFVVQVFSSGDQTQATRVRDKLQTSGYSAFLSPVEVNTQTMYRVRVGPYADRAEAETAAARVKRDFKYETWITR